MTFLRVTGARSLEIAERSVVVGTTSDCGIALRDPVASERHCRIELGPEGVTVEDLGSATGTYVNGVPVTGRTAVRDGDAVVVGVSRLVLSTVLEEGRPVAVLELAEAEFHYTKSGAGGARRDADDWVRSEVRFGRVRPVRLAGWVAALAAGVLVLLGVLGTPGASLLQPGPLTPAHARLFDGDGGGLPADQVALAAEAGCGACHDAYDRAPIAKCAACHGDFLRGRHPGVAAATGPSALSTTGLGANACLECHTEHMGREALRPPGGVEEERCLECHDAEQLGRNRAELESRPAVRAGTAEVETRRAAVPYDAFSHAAHLADGAGLACADCHVATREDPTAEDVFPPVTFATCRGCHDADPQRRDPARAALAARLEERELLFDVAWHGRENGAAGCRQCHEDPDAGTFRTVDTGPRDALAFELRRRDHTDEFHASGRACAECHVSGAPEPDVRPVRATFYHGVHVATSRPVDEREAERQSEACAACHATAMRSEHLSADRLAGAYGGAALESCAACHRDAAGGPLVLGVAPPELGGPEPRRDFPHALHQEVAGGCFACHDFEDPDDPFAATPAVRPEAASCSACHAEHRELGGGACQACHPAPGDGSVAAVFRAEPDWRDDWPVHDFRHFGSGHAPLTRAGRCSECHDDAAEARTVRELSVPREDQPVCVECHTSSRATFHFALRR